MGDINVPHLPNHLKNYRENMNKIQVAFAYLLNLLNGMYGTGWDLNEALADVALEFSLNEEEVIELQHIHQGFINNC
jgi:hypothetical protein